MVGIVIISENLEACEMMKTVKRLLGRTRAMTCVMLRTGQDPSVMEVQVRRAIKRVQSRDGVLLLADFFGSTQCNVCLKFLKKGSTELVTGFNLPMLIKLGSLHESTPLKKLISLIQEYGRKQIHHVESRRSIL